MTKAALFAAKHHEPCPECQAPLLIRTGRHGAFLGCSRYPDCQFMRPLKPNNQGQGHIVKVLESESCPLCSKFLVLRQGPYGMFICCEDYPGCQHIETKTETPDVALASVACPQCREGKVVQRKSRFGKNFYACDRYPDCKFAINHLPIAGNCEHCRYPLLFEKKTAQGRKIYCANKPCGKPQSTQ